MDTSDMHVRTHFFGIDRFAVRSNARIVDLVEIDAFLSQQRWLIECVDQRIHVELFELCARRQRRFCSLDTANIALVLLTHFVAHGRRLDLAAVA